MFFTNRGSRKGRHLAVNPRAAFTVLWRELDRQVGVTGTAAPIDDDESDAYFATRPREAQLGAWASAQSAVLPDRATLERQVEEVASRFGDGAVTRPPFWGGYRVSQTRSSSGRVARTASTIGSATRATGRADRVAGRAALPVVAASLGRIPTMDIDALRARIHDDLPRVIDELSRLVAIASVGYPGYEPARVRESAELTRDLLADAGSPTLGCWR